MPFSFTNIQPEGDFPNLLHSMILANYRMFTFNLEPLQFVT